MSRALRWVFLIFFVLLQGLVPLLHAHASPAGHGGVHMPVEFQSLLDGASGPAWHVDQRAAEEVAIGVAGSMQPRHDCSCGDDAGLPVPAWTPASPALPHGQIHPPDRLLRPHAVRLLPYPCAPPLA